MTEHRPRPHIDEVQDRQMEELLGELRLAVPGVQILLAFLLILPFQPRFERLTEAETTLYYVTLLASAASAICFLAPVAAHRLRFHKGDREWIIERSHRLAIAGLVCLGVAITGAIFLITLYLYDGPTVWIALAAFAVGVSALWFVMPLVRGRRRGRGGG